MSTTHSAQVEHFSKTVEEIDTAFFATIFGDVGRFSRDSTAPVHPVSQWLLLSFLSVPLSRFVDDSQLATSALHLELSPGIAPAPPFKLGDTITARLESLTSVSEGSEQVQTFRAELHRNHHDLLLSGSLIIRSPLQ